MARNETSAPHTAASLKHISEVLLSHATMLTAAAKMLEVEPPILQVDVRFESNRLKAMKALGPWVNEAYEVASKARITASQKQENPSIRNSPPKPQPSKSPGKTARS